MASLSACEIRAAAPGLLRGRGASAGEVPLTCVDFELGGGEGVRALGAGGGDRREGILVAPFRSGLPFRRGGCFGRASLLTSSVDGFGDSVRIV